MNKCAIAPQQIARVFLAGASVDAADGMPRETLQRRLRLCFDELTRACADALEANERLMEPNREEYRVRGKHVVRHLNVQYTK